MTITEANDVNTVLCWAMGHMVRYPGGPPVTDEDATEAARRLAGKASRALMAGLRPDEVTLDRAQTIARMNRARPPLDAG
jgi:hypothetical protein